jgi:hypothetical protein
MAVTFSFWCSTGTLVFSFCLVPQERYGMPEHNPNWQDTLIGGVIIGGLVAIAAIAALFVIFAPRASTPLH